MVTNPSVVFVLQIFSQEYINLLLSMYFFVLGILALSHTIRYSTRMGVTGAGLPNASVHFIGRILEHHCPTAQPGL